MKKCEVLQDTVISVLKGSIVMVSDRQYELKRNKLKPIEEVKKVEKPVPQEVETREEKGIETAELPKPKKAKKK